MGNDMVMKLKAANFRVSKSYLACAEDAAKMSSSQGGYHN